MSDEPLRVGTRRSRLARAQTGMVRDLLATATPFKTEEVLVTSRGDVDATRPLAEAVTSGPGLFTAALEDALRAGDIDVAVHSLKDLPLATPDDLPIVAVPPRADARDVLVVKTDRVDEARAPLGVAAGTRVGSSSPRRQAQLLAADPELVPTDVRGNVGTRLDLITKGVVDGVLLAAAGLSRGGFETPPDCTLLPLDLFVWPTCPGQGALAIQMRADDARRMAVAALDDTPTRRAVTGERALLGALGGGCGLPLGAACRIVNGAWQLDAAYALDGWRATHQPALAAVSVVGLDPVLLASRAAPELTHAEAEADAATARPLAGRRVLVTAADAARDAFVAAIEGAGGTAAAWSVTTHAALDETPIPAVTSAWETASWVVVASARAVPALKALARRPREGAPRYGAVGPGTARALRAADLPVHLVAPGGTGASLAAAVSAWTPPDGPVIAPGAWQPHPALIANLRDAGHHVVPWPVYKTTPAPQPVPDGAWDAVVVTAPSAARALPADAGAGRRIVALGPTTAAALKKRGFAVHGTAARRTGAAIVEVLTHEEPTP